MAHTLHKVRAQQWAMERPDGTVAATVYATSLGYQVYAQGQRIAIGDTLDEAKAAAELILARRAER